MMDDAFYELMRFSMGTGAVLPALLTWIPFLVVYVLGRMRENRLGESDGTLGPRVYLTLMMSMAFHIVLVGFTMMLSDLIQDDTQNTRRFRNPDNRYATALGMILGGGLAGLYPTTVYLLRYIKPSPAGIFRAALGINSIYTGVVFTVALTATMVGLLHDNTTIHVQLAFTITYFSANLACALPLLAHRRKPVRASRPTYQTPSPPLPG